MAFASMIRRSASAVVPLAIRVIGGHRYHHHCSALFSAVNHSNLSRQLSRASFPSILHYYSTSKRPSSDETLLRVIKSEINCAEESDRGQVFILGRNWFDKAGKKMLSSDAVMPDGFPFKIQDNLGEQTISFTREYQGETINVEVQMLDLVTGEDDDDIADDDAEKSNQSSIPLLSIPLIVRVSKSRGPCLEFTCTAFPDEISIDSLSIKDPESSEDQIAYEGPDFSDLDENLQRAFHKYLEVRGIKPNNTNFLHEYMISKESREYLMWLKNLEKFVEA